MSAERQIEINAFEDPVTGDITLVVKPASGLCEGCGYVLGEEFYETDDAVVVCRKCYELCSEDGGVE